MFKAGVGRVDISPEIGVQLAGYPHHTRENTGVHDPIYASAIHFNNGKTKVTTVFLDLLCISKKYTKRIRDEFDYPVTVSCTHTHCAPWVCEPFELDKKDGFFINTEYVDTIIGKIVGLIREVEKNTFDAEFATTVGKCGKEQGVGGNRCVKFGTCDPDVNVMTIREKGASVRAILVNYALHPTYLHAENTLVTSDYPNYIREYFRYAEPEALVMFAQGCSGNQSSRYHRTGQNFEEAARVGTTVACEADRVLENAVYTDEISIAMTTNLIDGIPMKVYPSPEEALKRKKEAEAYYESVKNADYITARNAELAMFGAQHIYEYCRTDNKKSPELPLEVTTLAINDTLLVQLQGEWFVEYGLQIKEMSKYPKTFVFEVSNGYLPGYMYGEKYADNGGYEVGNSCFSKDAEAYTIKKLKEIIENV